MCCRLKQNWLRLPMETNMVPVEVLVAEGLLFP
jgi:hypothetical protein